MLDYNLMHKANPLLFSQERYDQYPLNPNELMQYLTSTSATLNPRPVTDTDKFDYLLYTDSNDSLRGSNPDDTMPSGANIGDIDLEKKLACEFAIYQAHMKTSKSKKSNRKLDDLMNLEVNSDEWYNEIMNLLESVNVTNINLQSISNINHHLNRDMFDKYNPDKSRIDDSNDEDKEEDLQDLISYVLSNSIQNGLDIKPKVSENQKHGKDEFLKSIMDSMIDMAKANQGNEKLVSVGADEKKVTEMTTAFNDLQLAHNFLTKQFESGRTEHMKDIEKLTRTNRELQEKLLGYHSDLTKTENKLQETELKLLENHNAIGVGLASPLQTFPVDLPVLDIGSPVSLNSTSESPSVGNGARGSSSISIMRNEFKKLLTETQRKYEMEVNKERELRVEMEKKLKNMNKE